MLSCFFVFVFLNKLVRHLLGQQPFGNKVAFLASSLVTQRIGLSGNEEPNLCSLTEETALLLRSSTLSI